MIDWLGAILHAVTCSLGISALVLGGTVWEWSSIGSITLWVILGIVFGMLRPTTDHMFHDEPDNAYLPSAVSS